MTNIGASEPVMAEPAQKLPPLMTVAEFLEWPGDGTSTRYELVDGVLRAMAPASDTHGTIMVNIASLLHNHLRRHRPGCRVVGAPGIQPHLRADWNFRIPDLGVTGAANERGMIMTPKPIALIEVLSPGNAQKTWENVRGYATIPSVREILVVHQSVIRAELLSRDDTGGWPLNPAVVEAGGSVRLSSFDLTFPLGEAYAGTHLVSA